MNLVAWNAWVLGFLVACTLATFTLAYVNHGFSEPFLARSVYFFMGLNLAICVGRLSNAIDRKAIKRPSSNRFYHD